MTPRVGDKGRMIHVGAYGGDVGGEYTVKAFRDDDACLLVERPGVYSLSQFVFAEAAAPQSANISADRDREDIERAVRQLNTVTLRAPDGRMLELVSRDEVLKCVAGRAVPRITEYEIAMGDITDAESKP